MATTSTVPTVKAQIVTKLAEALATAGPTGAPVPVTYAWPGPQTTSEAVFLGRHPDLDDIRMDVSHDVPTIKAARKQRRETYDVQFTVWTFRPELTSADAETCETRAFALLDPIEDVFAEDPTIGLGATVVTHITVDRVQSTLWPFEAGWACELLVTVSVNARLQ